jgi:UDP-N-acetylmuramyl pentapeptide phosphotransferase/UDP-N-acetylglucosamine-1-phosphate transferase
MLSLLQLESFIGPPAPGMPMVLEMLGYFGLALVFSLIGTITILRSKSQIGLDAPDGRRKHQDKPISRLGGLPTFIALLLGICMSLFLGRMKLNEWGPL